MEEASCTQGSAGKVDGMVSVVLMKSVKALLSAQTGEAYKPVFLLSQQRLGGSRSSCGGYCSPEGTRDSEASVRLSMGVFPG